MSEVAGRGGAALVRRLVNGAVLAPSIVLVALLCVACGSAGGDDTVGGGPGAGQLRLVSTSAHWIGSDEPLSEFDVTVQKTDPTVLGVEVTWEFETHESNPDISPDIEASIGIDGQSVYNGSAGVGGGVGAIDRRRSGFYLLERDGGFTIDFVIGSLTGASDLVDPGEFYEFMAGAGVDVDSARQYLTIDFIEDEGGDGVLVYRIALSGTVAVDGQDVEIDAPVEFSAFESDPTAEAVANDESIMEAVAEGRAVEEAEAAGCEITEVVVDGGSFTITAPDGASIVSGVVPDDWVVNPESDDPCRREGVNIDTAAGQLIGLLLWPLRGEAVDDFAQRYADELNIIDVDQDGNPVFAQPGDDFFTEFAPVRDVVLASGRSASLAVGTESYSDGFTSNLEFLFIEAGTHTVFIRYFPTDENDTVIRSDVELLVDGLTITP